MTFRQTVMVCEYTRQLGGGGGVPSDGGWVALGLGDRAGTREEPLAEAPGPGAADMDDRILPRPVRVRLLRAAMGDAAYERAWAEQKHEMARLQLQRRLTVADAADWEEMPASAEEARERALAVSQEVGPPVVELVDAATSATAVGPAEAQRAGQRLLRRPAAAAAASGGPSHECGPTLVHARDLLNRKEARWGARPWSCGLAGALIRFDPCRRRFHLLRAGVTRRISITARRGWEGTIREVVARCSN